MTAALVLLSCGKAKRPFLGAARDVYDGPAFKMLRHERVDLLILSAKYGIIDGETKIAPYDAMMPAAPDAGFVAAVRRDLARRLAARSYAHVAVLLGERYSRVVGPLSAYPWGDARLTVTQGRIGVRLRALRSWLDATRAATINGGPAS